MYGNTGNINRKKSVVDRKQAQATLANEIRHDSAQLATLAN